LHPNHTFGDGGFPTVAAPDLDFLSALGEEFCGALSPPVPYDHIVSHDAYEVWRRAFGADPDPAALAALGATGVERLRTACAGYFECPAVSAAAVRLAVSRTLARWPAPVAEPSATPDTAGQ
jgi:hypothetical protein